jgi:hypothetical protein
MRRASNALCLLFILLWILSEYRHDTIQRQWIANPTRINPTDPTQKFLDYSQGTWELKSASGKLLFYFDKWLFTFLLNPGKSSPAPPLEIRWNVNRNDFIFMPPDSNALGFSYRELSDQLSGDWLPDVGPTLNSDHEGYIVAIPYWALVVVTALPQLMYWSRAFHRNRIIAANLCPHCRYDLRAHHPGDNCPECGTPLPAPLTTPDPQTTASPSASPPPPSTPSAPPHAV